MPWSGNQDGVCTLELIQSGAGVEVSTTPESDGCRAYCSGKGTFKAVYVKPPDACQRKAVAAARASFRRLMRAKAYEQALGRLEPLLQQCGALI
ncbi:MAG: hypothetical protein MO853_01030 [Candidatus Protistobacter heckmanni]|nr:hypothetical protein [Candidatus Protistobacter heckmanni]